MASSYRPWRYANRQAVRNMQSTAFRNNAAVYEQNAPPVEPSPTQRAASALDEATAPKKKGGGGLWGKVKDVGGDIAHGAKEVGEIALSGEKFQDALGINTEYMDALRKKGLVGKAAAFALDTATSPLTIATVGAGGWAGGAIRGATAGTKLATAGRVAGALAEPALSGNIARRAVAEVGAGVGAGLASEYASDRLEGAPRPVRALGALAAGVAGGAVGLNAGRIAKAAPEVTARVAAKTGLVPEGAVPFGAMVKIDGPMADDYLDVLVRHGIDPQVDENGFIRADPGELYDLADKVKGTVDEPLVNDILSASVENTRVPGSTAWGDRQVQRLPDETRPKSKQEAAGRDAAWAFVEKHKGETLEDARRAVEAELEEIQRKWFNPEMAEKMGRPNNDVKAVNTPNGKRLERRSPSDPRATRVTKVRTAMDTWGDESIKKVVGAEEFHRVGTLLRIQQQMDELASATFPEATVKKPDFFGNVEDTGKTETELNGGPPETPAAPVAKPSGPVIQQSFDGSVQELPGMSGNEIASPGKMVEPQPTVTTATGREIPAPPQIRPGGTTDRTAINDIRKQQAWLQEQALAEAAARGDDYNATMFRNEKPGKFPPATVDSMNQYLFGEPDPRWVDGVREAGAVEPPPRVAPEILRPMQPTAATAPEVAARPPRAKRPVTARPMEEPPPAGAPDAALGEPPRQGDGAPPPPPGKEPPPPSGTGPSRAFGQNEPVDLLGTRARKSVIADARAKEERVPAQVRNRIASALGRLDSEDARVKVGSIMGERNRIQNVREHQVAWALLKERAAIKGAGMETERGEDGFVHLFADGRDVGLFEDVVEQVSDAGRAGYASLTPDQQSALGAIGETNRLFNDTIRFHGGKPRIDPDIEGDYFGRRVTGRTYEGEGGPVRVEKAQGSVPSRKVGAGRTKSRVLESMEELQAKGFDTEDPWVAREAILRGKLLDAEDGYLKENLKSLRVKKPGSTLGLASVSGHPAFNNMWFEPDVARRIQKGLDTPAKGPLKAIENVNSVLTPLRASFDLSATWQQGMRLWLSDPKHASEYWWEVAKSVTKDDGVYDNLMLKMDAEGPGLQYLLERGLRFTGESTEGEFFFPKGLLEKTGKLGVAGKAVNTAFTKSNQQFGRLLNTYRTHMANTQYQRLVASGMMEGAELDDAMRQSVDGINRAFGWTHAKPSTIEQAVLFAPRYTRASIETLKAAITQGGIEGSMARKHLGLLLAEGAAVVWLLNTARGYETEFDPRDPNFLRLRNVGGLDVSPFGTYNTIFKTIATTVGGNPGGDGLPDPSALARFVEGKLSPAVGAAYWPMKGETYLGEPLDPTGGPKGFLNTVKEQAASNLPFGAQNLVKEGPVAAVVGSTGLSATPLTPSEKQGFTRDDVAKEMFGAKYDDLPGAQKAQVNENDKIKGYQREIDRRAKTQGGDRGMSAQIREQIAGELDASAGFLAAGVSDDGKRYTGNDFREAYHDTMLRAAGARKLIKDSGGDSDVDGWFKLYETSTMANGQTNYDALERSQAEYRAAHPGIDEKVEKITGIRDNAAVRELRDAKKLAKAYYEIPGYRGMTVEESEKAGEFLSLANDLVSFGKARNRRHALVLLREYDTEGARLAMKAARVGANPERKKFRIANPTFGRFYSDAGMVA